MGGHLSTTDGKKRGCVRSSGTFTPKPNACPSLWKKNHIPFLVHLAPLTWEGSADMRLSNRLDHAFNLRKRGRRRSTNRFTWRCHGNSRENWQGKELRRVTGKKKRDFSCWRLTRKVQDLNVKQQVKHSNPWCLINERSWQKENHFRL